MFATGIVPTAGASRAPSVTSVRAARSDFFGAARPSAPTAARPAAQRSFHAGTPLAVAVPPSEIKEVFVAGATGETGRLIVKELLERGVKVRAGVRNTDEAKGVVPEGATVLRADVTDSKMLPGCIGDASVVVCASGVNYRKGETKNPLGPYSVDYVGTRNLVEAAKAAGVKHFVLVTSLCVSKFFHPLNLFFLILFWKKQAEEHLRGSGVTYTIVRPGGLTNDAVQGEVLARPADSLFKGRIPRAKVAAIAAAAVFETDAYNKTVEIVAEEGAPARSPAQLFAAL